MPGDYCSRQGLLAYLGGPASRRGDLKPGLSRLGLSETVYAGFNQIPRLAGQIPQYLIAQLRAFKNGDRSDDTGNMRTLLAPLSEEDLEGLAHYFASLKE